MDILEEIDETIQDKKREWDYRPMREKNETDALIDELLKEFSSESSAAPQSVTQNSQSYRSYNERSEQEERREYEASVNQYSNVQTPAYPQQTSASQPMHQEKSANSVHEPENNDMTQVFSRKDIEEYEKNQGEADNNYAEYNGSQNDDYSGNAGFDDDYYDENDFDEDCDNLMPEDLDDDEYAEFEDYMSAREERKNQTDGNVPVSLPKKIWRIVYTAVIAAFTIIGIFSTGLYLFKNSDTSASEKKQKENGLKEEIAQVVYPLVAAGTEDFTSIEELTPEEIISISIGEIIINGNINVFKNEEKDEIIIEHTEIEYVASKLFGIEKKVDATDVEVAGIKIKYDKDLKSYIIPEQHDICTMYPVVDVMNNQEDLYTVSVGCHKDGPKWSTDKKTSSVKTIVFTLKKTSDYYNIVSAVTTE